MTEEMLKLRALGSIEEMREAVSLQRLVWSGVDTVPDHLLLTAAKNGGIVLGAYSGGQMVGFLFGFLGFHHMSEDAAQIKHCSHMLGVHPEYQGIGIGYQLKHAQWQLLRRQNISLATWTYDPLESRNAYLNVTRLGGMANKYVREVYGQMQDELNAGLPSDRLELEWWVDTARVRKRIAKEDQLTWAHYEEGGVQSINRVKFTPEGVPVPESDDIQLIESVDTRPAMAMMEIPANFQSIKIEDTGLALEWRMYTRTLFELFFHHSYIVTDFLYLPGEPARSYYLFSHQESLAKAGKGPRE